MHQLFGSSSSRDYDILFFVNYLGTIADNKAKVDSLTAHFQNLYPDKPVNINLGVLMEGELTAVYKGTVDEVNNSLLDTYSLHPQSHPQQITQRIERDVDLKILRGLRIMLSLISRTQYRKEVKKALSGDLTLKHQTLTQIDFTTITDLGNGKNLTWPDYYKTMSFQIGQILGLLSNIECYTKEHISEVYPDLAPMLNRTGHNLAVLEFYKQKLLSQIDPAKIKYQTETNRD